MEDKTSCPECGEKARVEWRFVLESTDGPIEHCKVRCVHGHWFVLPVSMLGPRVGTADAEPRPHEFATPRTSGPTFRARPAVEVGETVTGMSRSTPATDDHCSARCRGQASGSV